MSRDEKNIMTQAKKIDGRVNEECRTRQKKIVTKQTRGKNRYRHTKNLFKAFFITPPKNVTRRIKYYDASKK